MPSALSKTARLGRSPMNSNTSASSSHTHSAVSPHNICVRPTLEWGKLTVRYFPFRRCAPHPEVDLALTG